MSNEGSGDTRDKGSVLAAKAVETQGEGSVLSTKAVETQGEGSFLSTKAVETQGTRAVHENSGDTRRRRCLSHEDSGNARGTGSVFPDELSQRDDQPCLIHLHAISLAGRRHCLTESNPWAFGRPPSRRPIGPVETGRRQAGGEGEGQQETGGKQG